MLNISSNTADIAGQPNAISMECMFGTCRSVHCSGWTGRQARFLDTAEYA